MTTTSTPGERIRAAREIKRLSTAQLAERVPCSERSVQGWEAGSAKPKYEQIVGLARVLEVSADYLLGLPTQRTRRSS
jgi:transcriptional regulator with XRE-family HTH domain